MEGFFKLIFSDGGSVEVHVVSITEDGLQRPVSVIDDEGVVYNWDHIMVMVPQGG